jgi:Protein of unknown function (DUF1559)
MLQRLLLTFGFLAAFSITTRADDEAAIAAAKKRSSNSLKLMMLAIHSHHDAMNQFPNSITDKDGKPLLSWRVAILPYMEAAEAKLYKEFKLDEAWDSETNKKLIEKMPKIYAAMIGKTDMGHTYYQGFTGPQTPFEEKKLRFADFTDGLSNTLMVVEGEKTIEWTKPDNLLAFDPKKDTLPKVGGKLFSDGFHAAMGDGTVQFIKSTIEKEKLKALITRNGGEVIKE